MENLLAVNIGEDQTGLIVQGAAHAAGTASKACSIPLAPDEPEELTAQTSAEAGSVPFELTTGDPDEKPNLPALLATSVSTGVPEALRPNLR